MILDIPNQTAEFVQYAVDNVDHNNRTLDEHDTFHGMLMITAVSPGIRSNRPIPRVHVTKNMTHQRRSNGNAGTTVTFTGGTPVPPNKAHISG